MLTSHHNHCIIVAHSHVAPPAWEGGAVKRRCDPRQLGKVKHMQLIVLLVSLIKAASTTYDNPTALQESHKLTHDCKDSV